LFGPIFDSCSATQLTQPGCPFWEAICNSDEELEVQSMHREWCNSP